MQTPSAKHTPPDPTVAAMIELLQAKGYALHPGGQWKPAGEIFVGHAGSLRSQLAKPSDSLHPLEQALIPGQLAEIETRLRAQWRPLEVLNPVPTSRWVPLELVQAYLRKALRLSNLQLTMGLGFRVEYAGHLENYLKRYLNGLGRLKSEFGEYQALDEGFLPWAIEQGHRERLEAAYNERAVQWLEGTWSPDPLHLSLPGWSPKVVPHPWQNEVTHRALTEGVVINALDVGLGKTISVILLVAKAKYDGFARTPMVVVPKSVIGKWREEFLWAMPQAQVLMLGAEYVKGEWRDNTSAAYLSKQLAHLAAQDWTVVLISHDTFARIPMNPAALLERIQREYYRAGTPAYSRAPSMPTPMYNNYVRYKAEEMLGKGQIKLEDLERAADRLEGIDRELRELRERKSSEARQTKEQKAAERKYYAFLSHAARLINGGRKDNRLAVAWESLGVDLLVVDEAHKLKALYEPPDRINIKYLGDGPASQIAVDFYYKSRDILERNQGRGVYLATATPLVNSPIELFSMLAYVRPDLFASVGVSDVEQFIARYCDVGMEKYIDEEGEWREREVLKGLQNLRELREVCFRVIHRRTAAQVGLKLPEATPEYVLHKPLPEAAEFIKYVASQPLPALRDYMGISRIPADLKALTGQDYDKLLADYRLTLAHLLRRAELDMEMIDPDRYQGYVSPKVQGVLDDLKEALEGGGKAVVFCDSKDMFKGKARNPHGYSFHHKLQRLIAEHCAIHREQILICNAETAPDAASRLKMAHAINSGAARVIIGNTETMGEGVDLQKGVGFMFELDVPWNPKGLQQRHGRTVRQGNTLDEVVIRIHMGTRGLDVDMMDVLRGKSNWYSEFWDGDSDYVASGDQSVIPSREQIMALAIDDDGERRARLDELREAEEERRKLELQQEGLEMFRKYQLLYTGLEQHRRKYGDLPEYKTHREERVRMEGNLLRQAERLRQKEPFAPYLHLLERPLEVVVVPEERLAVELGQRYLLTSGNSVQVVEVSGILNINSVEIKSGSTARTVLVKNLELQPFSPEAHARAHFRGRENPAALLHEYGERAYRIGRETFAERVRSNSHSAWVVWKPDRSGVEVLYSEEVQPHHQPAFVGEAGVFESLVERLKTEQRVGLAAVQRACNAAGFAGSSAYNSKLGRDQLVLALERQFAEDERRRKEASGEDMLSMQLTGLLGDGALARKVVERLRAEAPPNWQYSLANQRAVQAMLGQVLGLGHEKMLEVYDLLFTT